MKRIVFSLVFLGGLLFIGTGIAHAVESGQEPVRAAQTSGGFVDSNGDGICDNYDGIRPGKGQGPGSGQGLGQSSGKGLGKGNGLKNGSGSGQRRLDGTGGGRNAGNGRQLRDGSGGNCAPQVK